MTTCEDCPDYNGSPLYIAMYENELYKEENELLKTQNSILKGEVESLEAAIDALMAERLALRSYAAALALITDGSMSVSYSRFAELSKEHLRLEGIARRACEVAGLRLDNVGDQAKRDRAAGVAAEGVTPGVIHYSDQPQRS